MNLVKKITDAMKSDDYSFHMCSVIRRFIPLHLYRKVNIYLDDIEDELYQRELKNNNVIKENLNKILDLILIDSN